MKVTESAIDLGSLIVSEEQSATRTPGLHVSTIIRYLAKTSGLRKDNDFTETDLEHFAVFGRVWEHHMARTLFQPPRYERVGELEVDGILGSPDGIDIVEDAVVEFKVTWKSMRHPVESFLEYKWQIMSYCHMLQVCRARLVVAYVCGDWKPPKPQGKQCSLVFTPAELRGNWDMIRKAGDEMVRGGS